MASSPSSPEPAPPQAARAIARTGIPLMRACCDGARRATRRKPATPVSIERMEVRNADVAVAETLTTGDADPVAEVAADAALLAGRRYEPLGEVARGGTGRIVRARD